MSLFKGLLVISAGASLGAILRWVLGIGLNGLFPFIPLGTLVANVVGGFLIGVAFGAFTLFPTLAPEWRLFIVTGFLGALTTFSTFSLEVWQLFQQQKVGWGVGLIGLHLLGSLLALGCGVVLTHFCVKQLS